MAIALEQTQYLTYEEYLAEGEVMKRYDILDGVRHFMTNPTGLHQKTLGNIYILLIRYQRESGAGEALIAPLRCFDTEDSPAYSSAGRAVYQ